LRCGVSTPVTILIGLVATAFFAVPASTVGATVHEQVGAACGGNADLAPPGISGGSNADNFARPLLANGVAVITGSGDNGPNIEIGDSPAAKYPAGTPILIDRGPQPLPEMDHPASHCKALR
jgi:hypothetical protein